jgi:ankyrin repeat protein
MPKSCIVCSAEASLDLQLQYCSQCQSALYCSKTCQRKDWTQQHKKICKLLNVGHGGLQVHHDIHASRRRQTKTIFEEMEQQSLDEDDKQFFKLFKESTFEGSRAAAQKMRKIVKRQDKNTQELLLFHSLRLLTHSKSEMLSWPNSPLLVLLQFVDPDVLFGDEPLTFTPLHRLADLADPYDYSTHENQLILAKQLIEHGATVNALLNSHGMSPLHKACYSYSVTNLDFVELLLENGADPNAKDHNEMTPLMYTNDLAPGAAKFLLNWPTTDVNILNGAGEPFLAMVRSTISSHGNPL